jgi:predicted nucleic acid-binding protein
MSVYYIDSSAIIAVLYEMDSNHRVASEIWLHLVKDNDELVCTNYVLLETFSLLQCRYGIDKAHALEKTVMPLLRVEWLGEDVHRLATTSVFANNQRDLSLVDCSSFETMRRLDIRTAFAFDEHFREQGFIVIP